MNKKDLMEMHKMYASWWLHAASNGHSERRDVTDGNGRKLTPEELVDDAMHTANQHIHSFIELAERPEK